MDIIVLIPTLNRSNLFQRALKSVAMQTVTPEKVIVINQSIDREFEKTIDIISKFDNSLDIEMIKNNRSQNLSGAINSGLKTVTELRFDPETTFLALLDDDDWWIEDYLETMYQNSIGVDWVISGIIRHDDVNIDGQKQKIPEDISISSFLVGNPNIQGSNLYIKLAPFLKIDGFDEKLDSTTDRDVCIRLLQLGSIKYKIIDYYGVHHYALDTYDRLSTPGNELKERGLKQFYDKYHSIMSEDEKNAFVSRAKLYFDIIIDL